MLVSVIAMNKMRVSSDGSTWQYSAQEESKIGLAVGSTVEGHAVWQQVRFKILNGMDNPQILTLLMQKGGGMLHEYPNLRLRALYTFSIFTFPRECELKKEERTSFTRIFNSAVHYVNKADNGVGVARCYSTKELLAADGTKGHHEAPEG